MLFGTTQRTGHVNAAQARLKTPVCSPAARVHSSQRMSFPVVLHLGD